ncbi:hypothetical protein HG535_0B03680 [Zygotorulaspora mrakii]|uniref:DNA helicase n=1 Tax=Zygotorulaspora mrakii TaxID=42260 RepID=A0A7H9B018_ZYGMR|nr:uncharacterized protein HG535_0B03680 [Zygotorulaspora mrakii]QLG71329.1 hypothetical protein HG535_0B03680 [Zygotorulaspora mrakii]
MMSDGDNGLRDLGVNILDQSLLEQKIETNAESLITQQLVDQEHNRLERVENALEKCRSKRNHVRRKLDNASRISVKQRLRQQIEEIEELELPPLLKDIRDIKERLKNLKTAKNPNQKGGDNQGKRPDESQKEFLIRTGHITAFGSKTEFVLEKPNGITENEALEAKEEADQNMEMANEQMIENMSGESTNDDYDYDDDDYASDDQNDHDANDNIGNVSANEAPCILKPGVVKDDGDEASYQKRLRKWVDQRSQVGKGISQECLPEWRKAHPDIPDAKLNDDFKIPGEIFSLLFDYQKTCVQWLYELYQQKSGGIIGDEMGLGKTIQIIAFLAGLHHSGLLNGPVIIVCPATVMKQWCNEFHHWWPPLRVVILHAIGSGFANKKTINEDELEGLIMSSDPTKFSYDDFANSAKTKSQMESNDKILSLIDMVIQKGHVIVTTYVGLRIHSDKLLAINWAYAVLDEGHKIRNPDADISLTCKKLKTHNRIILSGTPIQNNLNELWSLFDFIFPGKLGTLPVFQQQFVQPINMGGYANATNVQVQAGYKCAVALRDLISPYLLRRVKADVAKDLPEKKEMVLFCKLTQFQRGKYLEFLHSKELEQIKGGKRQVLYGIDILRKICNHPDLLDREAKQHEKSYGDPKRSGKMQVVKQLLLLWRKEHHKTLLFTQSRQMLDILEQFISFKDEDLNGIKYLRMDGTTGISIRQSLVDEFNNGDYDVFLLTTRVGGLGVNLTGANRIIIFDPDWNPSTDMQARERAWRIGQKREVSIYRLMVTGSIEEKIYHRQIFKQFLTNKILSDPKQKRFFKMNELHDLFTLGGDGGHTTEELDEEVQKHTDSLLNSRTQESDDFGQVLNMAGVFKLESFYSGKEKKEKGKNEDDRLIEGLLGEKNLESVVAHDSMVRSHSKASPATIEKEAERVAQEALTALKKSRKTTRKFDIGTPTWTGKFGQAGKVRKKIKKDLNGNSVGSSAILANIRAVKHEAQSVQNQDFGTTNAAKNRSLLQQIVKYLSKQENYFASSVDIVKSVGAHLNDKSDIIKIRALLRTIAAFDKDKRGWILQDEFKDLDIE